MSSAARSRSLGRIALVALAVLFTGGAAGPESRAPGALEARAWVEVGDRLWAIDPETGRADLDSPKLDAEPAFEGFSIGPGRLTWSAPDDAGDSTVQVLAWDGDTFGRLEILSEGGTKVVR